MRDGHIRPRGKGSWELKFDLPRDPVTGKRRTRYVSFRGTKSEARAHLRILIGKVEERTYVEPAKMTLKDYLERWLEHARTTVSPRTHERYGELLRNHVSSHLGATKLSDLQPIQVQELYRKLLSNGRLDGKGALSGLTVKHIHRVFKEALRQAVRWKMLAANPADNVDPPKAEHSEIEILEPEHVEGILIAIRRTRLLAPVIVALNTGLRRGELLALRWKDIDFEGTALTVRQSLEETGAGLRFKEPKSRRSRRTVALPAAAVDTLRHHKLRQMETYLKLGSKWSTEALVFGRFDGQPIRPRNFSKEFSRVVKRAGLKVTFHGLRHTHATMLLKQNVHPKIVSDRLGHASVAITLDTYSHVIPSMQDVAARAMDELFANIREP